MNVKAFEACATLEMIIYRKRESVPKVYYGPKNYRIPE